MFFSLEALHDVPLGDAEMEKLWGVKSKLNRCHAGGEELIEREEVDPETRRFFRHLYCAALEAEKELGKLLVSPADNRDPFVLRTLAQHSVDRGYYFAAAALICVRMPSHMVSSAL